MRKSLYKTIYDDFYLKLQDGTYNPGDLLPSEMELEKIYNASRTPIRQALNELEHDGLIYRLQGKGSFAANKSPVEQWTMSTGFGSQYSKEWQNISAKTISLKYVQSKKYTKEMGLNEEVKLIYLERIRFFNNEPFVYMQHYIKPVVPITIFTKDEYFVSAAGKLIKDKLNIKFTNIKEEVEAVVANEITSKYLEVNVGFPLLKIKRLSYNEKKLIDINIYYVRTDKWKYNIGFKEK